VAPVETSASWPIVARLPIAVAPPAAAGPIFAPVTVPSPGAGGLLADAFGVRVVFWGGGRLPMLVLAGSGLVLRSASQAL
jgi:hypothetical protein